jgi:hypothetical protein
MKGVGGARRQLTSLEGKPGNLRVYVGGREKAKLDKETRLNLLKGGRSEKGVQQDSVKDKRSFWRA